MPILRLDSPWLFQPQRPVRLNRNHFAASSLVAHWPLAGDSLNVLTGEKGEILSGATQTVTRTGRAYNFDGTANGIIKVGVNYLNTVLTNNFTVACFFTPNGANDLDDVILATGAGRTLFGVTATNQIIGRHYYGVEYKLTGATALTTGKTYFVVWTKSSVTGSRIYIDGVLDASNATSYYLQASDNYAGEHTAIGATPYGGAIYNKIAAKISDLSVFKSVLSDSEVRLLSKNPWQIFEPDEIPVAFGAATSGTIITCAAGNAVAAGQQASVISAITVSANTGNAVAAGLQTNVATNVTITANAGNAVAAGSQAGIIGSATITTSIGNAVAAGLTAAIEAGGATTITCSFGNAVAAGQAAQIASNVLIGASIGNAVAAGIAANVQTASTIAANVGNAVAIGLPATVTGISSIVINCATGNVLANGYQANVVETSLVKTLGVARFHKQEFAKRSNIQTSGRNGN